MSTEIAPLNPLTKSEYWEVWTKGIPETILDHFRERKKRITILEAGCGREFHMEMDELEYDLVAVDLSREALDFRASTQENLQEAILGDLSSVELPDSQFDVIYCSYVLEHIDGADQVLDRFLRWLKPGGLVILLIPDRNTIRGFFTRITPFPFHVWFYRYINGDRNAGKPGFVPFKTYLDNVVSRVGIHDFCDAQNVKVVAEHALDFDIREQFGSLSPLARAFFRFVVFLSGGKIKSNYTDLIYVISKAE